MSRVSAKSSQPFITLALSGGGSRAIAFHLGCLRALHDRNLLDKVKVVSTVSGGSVIGACFAYWDVEFAEFDRRVVRILRNGLTDQLPGRCSSVKKRQRYLRPYSVLHSLRLDSDQ